MLAPKQRQIDCPVRVDECLRNVFLFARSIIQFNSFYRVANSMGEFRWMNEPEMHLSRLLRFTICNTQIIIITLVLIIMFLQTDSTCDALKTKACSMKRPNLSTKRRPRATTLPADKVHYHEPRPWFNFGSSWRKTAQRRTQAHGKLQANLHRLPSRASSLRGTNNKQTWRNIIM